MIRDLPVTDPVEGSTSSRSLSKRNVDVRLIDLNHPECNPGTIADLLQAADSSISIYRVYIIDLTNQTSSNRLLKETDLTNQTSSNRLLKETDLTNQTSSNRLLKETKDWIERFRRLTFKLTFKSRPQIYVIGPNKAGECLDPADKISLIRSGCIYIDRSQLRDLIEDDDSALDDPNDLRALFQRYHEQID